MFEKPIAIVGMDCRLPSAASVSQFWDNLCNKRSGIVRLSGADKAGMHVSVGYLDDVDRFDYQRFRMGKREASLIDPQHRLFLTCAANVLEHIQKSDFTAEDFGRRVGVFASCPMNTYLKHTKNHIDTSLHTLEGLQATLQNDKDYLALRTANILNLTGPAVDLQTSCSSSATATHYACLSLAAMDCDIALVGGATVMNPQLRPYQFIEGSIFSSDGHCRPFTDYATGTVHGNGVALVALKRLEDANRDGNPIFGVIISSAINNNGNRQDGITAPSVEGWREVMERALEGIDVESIGVIETHGTGTRLGDRVEMEALTSVFSAKSQKKAFCSLGTAKSHIGHLEAACGVVSIIKAACSLTQKKILSDIYDGEPINLADTPFYFPQACMPWQVENGAKRRVSVNSSGMGGTNVHLVIEEPPAERTAGIGDLPGKKSEKVEVPRCWAVPQPESRDRSLGIKLKDTGDEIIYETLINLSSFDWLKDHALAGSAIVPGTYFVHLLRNAARAIDHQITWKLESVEFKGILAVTEGKATLRTSIHKTANGWSIQIESRGADSWESTVHAVALATPSEPLLIASPHLSELLRGKQEALSVADVYNKQLISGLYHGTHFQKMRHAVETPVGVLGVIADFEGHLKEQVDREVCLLDSCLQLFRFVHGQNEAGGNSGYLLTSFRKIDISALPWRDRQGIWCLAKRQQEAVGNHYITDFVFFSEDGEPIGEIQGAQERGVGYTPNESNPVEVPVREVAAAKNVGIGFQQLIELLKELAADSAGNAAPDILPTDTLAVLGVDSFASLELSLEVQSRLNSKIDFLQEVKPEFSIEEIATRILDKLGKAGA